MQLTLKNFDSVEDNETTEKGLQYYRDGAISYIEEIDTGEWEASVMGTELYSVAVNLKKLKINATGCDCRAFEHNEYCKHVAAVLYAIRDRLATESTKTKIPKDKKPKAKTALHTLHEVVSKLEAKELIEFIKTYSAHNKEFTNDVLLYFKLQAVVNETSEEGFIEVVKAAVDSSREKGEFDNELLAKLLKPIITQAQKYVTDANYLEAFYVIKAIIEVVAPFINDMSYAFRGSDNALVMSLDLLEKISGFTIPPMFRDELFDYCLSLSAREEFLASEYDRRIDQLLPRLANDNQRKEQILQLIGNKLNRLIPTGTRQTTIPKLGRHLAYLRYKAELLNDLHREKEAEQLLRDNLFYHDELAHAEIRRAIENKDAAYAHELVEARLSGDAVRTDTYFIQDREKAKWQPYFLDIAILENDIPEIISYAEKFFKVFQDIRFYDILKQYYPKDQWHRKFEEIESSLFRKHYSFGILATIYVREGKLKDLFELLKKHAFLNNIRDTTPVLLPVYRTEVLALYHKVLISLLGHGTVSAYKETVEHLNYLLSLGQKEAVHEWVESFKSIYSNRSRFLKELAKVKV